MLDKFDCIIVATKDDPLPAIDRKLMALGKGSFVLGLVVVVICGELLILSPIIFLALSQMAIAGV